MLKQLAQDAAKSMLKDRLLSQLNGLGCKGKALADYLDSGFFPKRAADGVKARLSAR